MRVCFAPERLGEGVSRWCDITGDMHSLFVFFAGKDIGKLLVCMYVGAGCGVCARVCVCVCVCVHMRV